MVGAIMRVPVLLALVASLAAAACQGKRTPPPAARDAATGGASGALAALADAGLTPLTSGEAVATVDRSAETRALFAVWNQPDAAATIHGNAHPTFQKSVKLDELRIFHDDFTAASGAYVEVAETSGSRRKRDDGVFEDLIFGQVRFARGLAAFELVLTDDGGAPRLLNLKLELPEELKPPPDRAAARALARSAADALLATDLVGFDAMCLPRLRDGRTADDIARLKQMVAALGGGVRLEIVKDEACGEVQHCLAYHAVGRRGGASLSLRVAAPLSRWHVNDWSFELDEEKPTP
jgi:hypothetical protein